MSVGVAATPASCEGHTLYYHGYQRAPVWHKVTVKPVSLGALWLHGTDEELSPSVRGETHLDNCHLMVSIL